MQTSWLIPPAMTSTTMMGLMRPLKMKEVEPNHNENENLDDNTTTSHHKDDVLESPSTPREDPNDNSPQHTHMDSPPRAKRTRIQPSYLKDYIMNLPPIVDHTQPTPHSTSLMAHSLGKYLLYDKFSNIHRAA